MKRAIFYCEKVIKDKKESIIVNGWENVLKINELPEKYLSGYPYFYEYEDRKLIAIYKSGGEVLVLEPGKLGEATLISVSLWNKLYNNDGTGVLQQAGERLSRILKEKKWSGKFRVKI